MAESENETEQIAANRIVYVKGHINEEQTYRIVEKLLDYETKNPYLDILMYVDSYGGYADSFFAIHDAMKMCRCDIATIALGKAMSCGQLILMSGTKGKRFVTPNSRIMMHQIASGHSGKVHQLEVEMEEVLRLQSVVDKMIIKNTLLKKKDLKAMAHKENFYSAEKAVEVGLADHIIKKPSDLYSRVKLS